MFSLKSTKSSTKETNTSPARTKDRDKIVGLSVWYEVSSIVKSKKKVQCNENATEIKTC